MKREAYTAAQTVSPKVQAYFAHQHAEAPRPRIEAIRIVDMSSSNSWAEFAGLFRNTRDAFLDHERAKTELKALMPEDAKEAIGHGVRAKRSKSGAVSFDVLATAPAEANHAPVQ
jgi:hypothetical protein